MLDGVSLAINPRTSLVDVAEVTAADRVVSDLEVLEGAILYA